jgi:hemerythrin superfamily protein
MVASARKGTRRATQSPSRSAPPMDTDVIDLLSEDHRKVEELFEDYESSKDEADDEAKAALVATICLELTVHATVEEEIFYPAAREALDEEDADMLDEAEVEHMTVKVLIADLADMQPSDALYDAKVKVLSEYVKHHVQEEEGEIFPSVRETELDLAALGEEIATRKQELADEYEASE